MNLISALKSIRIFSKKDPLLPLATTWGRSLDPLHVREEYPRPQMVREQYTILNGRWDYSITSKKDPIRKLSGKILVPFSPEASLSGVNRQLLPDEVLLCERALPDSVVPSEGNRCILHFGAVDQHAKVFINGAHVTSHMGGYLPFSVDITDALREHDNRLQVRIEDRSDTSWHSTGKQKLKRGGMFYTAQSGIWQTVWTETVPDVHIESVELTPSLEKETVFVCIHLNRPLPHFQTEGAAITCRILDAEGQHISRGTCTNQAVSLCTYSCYCDVNDMQCWTPDSPFLYTAEITAGRDCVRCYFAMRSFTIEPDEHGVSRFCLNHEPLFLNGVLNQGYWPDGLYTAPADEAMVYDIRTMKALGFNMIRMHAKIECARWYYHCDRLGMIVWQDMVNGGRYHAPLMTWLPTAFPWLQSHVPDSLCHLLGRRDKRGREEFVKECEETVRLLSSFPCISTWVLFNEGWGQFHSTRLLKKIRALDPKRLIDAASGWFGQGQGDFKSEHNYFRKLKVPQSRRAFALTEYGGSSCSIAGHSSTKKVYGYRHYSDPEMFQEAFSRLMEEELPPLIKKGLCAAVYTQLSDIEEEKNGLLTYDRKVCKVRKHP